MTMVVAVVILVGMSRAMPRMRVPVCIQTIIHVHGGMRAPVGVALFPLMETHQPDGIARQPVAAGTQIKIICANDADEFEAVPNIRVRNRYGDDRRRDLHRHNGRRRLHDDDWPRQHG